MWDNRTRDKEVEHSITQSVWGTPKKNKIALTLFFKYGAHSPRKARSGTWGRKLPSEIYQPVELAQPGPIHCWVKIYQPVELAQPGPIHCWVKGKGPRLHPRAVVVSMEVLNHVRMCSSHLVVPKTSAKL
jgi:hypothetical protein